MEISEERWNVARSESWNVEGEDNSPKLRAGGDGEAREGLQWQIWRWWSREFKTHDTTYYYISKLPRRSNGRVRERKQKGRVHWWRGKCWTAREGTSGR